MSRRTTRRICLGSQHTSGNSTPITQTVFQGIATVSADPGRKPGVSELARLFREDEIDVHLDVLVHLEHAEHLAQPADVVVLEVEGEITAQADRVRGEPRA